MEAVLKEKIKSIDHLVECMKKARNISALDILQEEIGKLRRLNQEYEGMLRRKAVKEKQETPRKIKYTLNDGSVYVVHKSKKYRYLYDAASSVVTYEFENGQIERTFPSGIKEIRTADGKIVIKESEKEYDVISRE